jgi:hypothetical protein
MMSKRNVSEDDVRRNISEDDVKQEVGLDYEGYAFVVGGEGLACQTAAVDAIWEGFLSVVFGVNEKLRTS